jgi:hypothetical protein
MKGHILFTGEINAKIGWGHLKSSGNEPLSQKSSDLHESFLTQCRIKCYKIMVHKAQKGPQKGKPFLYALRKTGYYVMPLSVHACISLGHFKNFRTFLCHFCNYYIERWKPLLFYSKEVQFQFAYFCISYVP